MIRLFKKRREDFFRTGQKTGFLNLFRLWLNWTDAGICRSCRSAKNAQNTALEDERATEPDQGIPCPDPGSDAWESPGRIALCLLLKKRSETALSDKTAEDVAASGKAVQE
jgi:hypothetical protein